MNRWGGFAGSIVALGAACLALSQQSPAPPGRGGGPGGGPPGGLVAPAYYTNRSAPLGPVDTAAADRACSVQGVAKLVCLADLLKEGLAPALRARLQLSYSVQDAKKWSNFPPLVYHDRVGVTLAEFTPAQLGVVKALLKHSLGLAADEGFDEIEQILNADDLLKEMAGQTFASGNFQIAFIGTPAARGTWQLYFGGHHLQVTMTHQDGVLSGATPAFRGIEPFGTYTANGRENAPLSQEHAAFAAVLAALSPEEQGKARLTQTFTDIIIGPQQDDNFPGTKAGIRVGELSQQKQALLLAAIDRYVGDINGPDATRLMAKYRSELADTWLSYSGTTGLNTENDYVRVDGPTLWIEFSMQPGRVLPGIHPHTVWRDRGADYGGNR